MNKIVGLDGLPWRNCTTTEESTTKRSTCSTSLRRSAKEPKSSAGLACGARKTSASSLVKRLAADLYVTLEKAEVIVVTEEADKVNDDERDAAKLGKAFLLHSAMPKLGLQRCAKSDNYRRERNSLIFNGMNKTCRIQLETTAFATYATG